jgi:hypothetical protein
VIRTNPNGLTEREQLVLDLWDSGIPAEAIARRLGLQRTIVKGILSTFASGRDNWEEAARRASAALADAVRRHHPEQLRDAA